MPPGTFAALLRRNAEGHGGVRAIVTPEDAITHGELEARSHEVARRLVAAGVQRGDRVGLLAPNGIDWVVVAAAVLLVGGVLVPLSTLAKPPELEALLRTAEVRHLVAARTFKGRSYLEEIAGLEVPSLRSVWPVDVLPAEAGDPASVDALEAAVDPGDDLVVLFTSGSTGTPKGTIHTHRSALGASAAGLEARGLGAGSRLYMPMPFFWTGGFATALVSTLVAGATLLTEAEPEPARTLAFLERERVTLFRGWPDQAAALAAHPGFADADLSSLGDGSLPAALPAERRPAPGTRPNIFGMTETFGPWCGDRLDLDLPKDKQGSCGRPFEGVEARVVHGQIQLRGPNLLRGVVGRTHGEVFTDEGWYPTGDLGRIDDDGYVYFDGRADDMFKVKGATVYPAEVEAALRAIDGVRQAHVTDVAGEVAAIVVTEAEPDHVHAAARARLSAFKVPTRWLLTPDLDDIPQTATGKVDKQALRALMEEQA